MRTFVTAVFDAKPGKEDEVERIFRTLVEPTHSDAGCISYALNRGQDAPRRFVFMEEWDSRENLDAHLEADHIKDGFAELEDLLESRDIVILERIAGGDVGGTA